MILELLFWTAIAIIVYTYALYPGLVLLRGLFQPKPYKRAAITPQVSMVIAAYNEADTIGAKLDNILSLNYPDDALEVIIASDGSNDGTNRIVQAYDDPRINLLALPRLGKAAALNAAVEAATGDVLVFSDANSIYAADAIFALVEPFADPEVGGVAGNQRYRDEREQNENAGERSYWRFDRRLKDLQSRAGNTISATGAIYAIRRSLFRTVPEGVTDDFVTSTRVIAQGYRLVFAPDAVAYEPAMSSGNVEFSRKVRVITRGLRSVWVMRELLNPFRYGFYAIQIFSHKVMRRLVAFPLLFVLLISPFLWQHGPVYQVAAIGQLGFYGLGLAGLVLDGTRLGRQKIFSLPFFFCMVNTAVLVATVNVLRGHRIVLWEPQRADSAQEHNIVKGQ